MTCCKNSLSQRLYEEKIQRQRRGRRRLIHFNRALPKERITFIWWRGGLPIGLLVHCKPQPFITAGQQWEKRTNGMIPNSGGRKAHSSGLDLVWSNQAFTALVIAGRGLHGHNEIYYRQSKKPSGPFAGPITRKKKIMEDWLVLMDLFFG